MELRSFIATSIADIYQGVIDAQKVLPPGTVIPRVRSHYKSVETKISDIQVVNFEVRVKVDEQKGKAAKIGVVTGFLGGGISENSSKDSGHSGTLSFSIPIRFPASGAE